MERFKLSLGKVVAVLAPVIILPFALAEESPRMGEDYYGNNIDAAILEADQNKRTVNYTNKYWYNRTTSKSFVLPDMAPDELEKENLPGALGATAAGGENLESGANLAGSDQVNIIEKNNSDSQQQQQSQVTSAIKTPVEVTIDTPPLTIENITYTFPRGDMVSTHGISSSTVLISTPRP